MPNTKGTRNETGQGSWSARKYPADHPKAGKVRLHVFRKSVQGPDGKSVVVQGTGKTKAVATANYEHKLKGLTATLAPGLDPRTLTVGQWVPVAIDGYRDVGESTRTTYRRIFHNHIEEHSIATRRLVDLNAIVVDRFVQEKATSGLAARYVNGIRIVLLAALRSAWGKGVDVDPRCWDSNAVPASQIVNSEPPALTGDQAQKLIATARAAGDPLWFFCALALASGARIGELLGARTEDFEATWWHVCRKVAVTSNGGSRVEPFLKDNRPGKSVALSPAIVAMKDVWLAGREGYVFVGRNGRHLTHNEVQQAIKVTYQRAGLPVSYTPHTLRHTASRLLRRLRADPRAVADHLGHSAAVMASTYWDTDPEIALANAAKLSAVLTGDR